ncbi:hypothetical protein [Actinoplanes sp. NPDC049599]|uniref:hypothetical protein n=1 Tax=Actinoplanes sp. NPDC049599 TaxID=3363903 RepID=UPI0037B3AA5F
MTDGTRCAAHRRVTAEIDLQVALPEAERIHDRGHDDQAGTVPPHRLARPHQVITVARRKNILAAKNQRVGTGGNLKTNAPDPVVSDAGHGPSPVPSIGRRLPRPVPPVAQSSRLDVWHHAQEKDRIPAACPRQLQDALVNNAQAQPALSVGRQLTSTMSSGEAVSAGCGLGCHVSRFSRKTDALATSARLGSAWLYASPKPRAIRAKESRSGSSLHGRSGQPPLGQTSTFRNFGTPAP